MCLPLFVCLVYLVCFPQDLSYLLPPTSFPHPLFFHNNHSSNFCLCFNKSHKSSFECFLSGFLWIGIHFFEIADECIVSYMPMPFDLSPLSPTLPFILPLCYL